jgi:hypothetical protein
MQVGDMVKTRMGYSAPGIVIELIRFPQESEGFREYAKVMWSDYGLGLEKRRDLVVVSSLIENEGNKE